MKRETFTSIEGAPDYEVRAVLHDHPADKAFSEGWCEWDGHNALVDIEVHRRGAAVGVKALYHQHHIIRAERMRDAVEYVEALATATVIEYMKALDDARRRQAGGANA